MCVWPYQNIDKPHIELMWGFRLLTKGKICLFRLKIMNGQQIVNLLPVVVGVVVVLSNIKTKKDRRGCPPVNSSDRNLLFVLCADIARFSPPKCLD